MAASKKLVALTNIKHNGEEINAGDEVDAGQFSEQQLKDLVDNGAVEVAGTENKNAQATNEGEQQLKAGEDAKPAATEQKGSSAASAQSSKTTNK